MGNKDGQAVVYLATLGICEHCQTLLNMQDMPMDSMDAEWKCSKCKGVLTNKSFGYEITGKKDDGSDKWEKTRWVRQAESEPRKNRKMISI